MLYRSDFDISEAKQSSTTEDTLELLDMTEREIEREMSIIERENELRERSRPAYRRFSGRRGLGGDIRNFITIRPSMS